MLVLVAAAELFVSRNALTFMDTTEFDWMSSRRATRKLAAKCDILCFGDSMLKFGVVPRVLEATLGRKVYNLALLDGKPALAYTLFRRALAAGAKPSALIVDFAPEQLKQPPWHLLINAHWNALMASPREAWELASTYHNMSFFGRLVVAGVLPSFRCREQIRLDFEAGYQGWGAPNREQNLLLHRNRRTNSGNLLLAKKPEYRGDVPPQCVSDLLSIEFEILPENASFVHRLLRLAAEHRIAVFWLMPPNAPKVIARRDEVGLHAKYDAFARRLLARFPNLTVLDARHAGYRENVFVDPVHLDRDGAVALSSDIAEVLENALSHAQPVPRWVHLPDYRERPVAPELEDLEQSRMAVENRDGVRRR
jgi:hypothetical protein